MFLKELKTALVVALGNTFDGDYPVADFQNLHVSIEYPIEKANYPAVWVDFEPTSALQKGGIDQAMYKFVPNVPAYQGLLYWRFQGFATFTIVALTSLERDRLFDELVRVMAFSFQNPQTSVFRQSIDNNPYIAMNMGFDEIQMRGSSEVPGTPWGTEEIMYEITAAIQVIGEFYSEPSSTLLYPLSEIDITGSIVDGPEAPTIKYT